MFNSQLQPQLDKYANSWAFATSINTTLIPMDHTPEERKPHSNSIKENDLNLFYGKILLAHNIVRQMMMRKTKHLHLPTLKIGQKVWLNNKNLFLYQKRIHNIFHASLLTLYTENFLYRQYHKRPMPDLDKGEETYEVEVIINHRLIRNRFHYLMKWEGYLISENTWEPSENLEKARNILQ
ncbi:hypothetical protein AN958_12842 [Leucoagaricus sp. SymC.cos]|nr:hypothetical protein AN958_12842 [Leucoagaricus sp. SymC.cos]